MKRQLKTLLYKHYLLHLFPGDVFQLFFSNFISISNYFLIISVGTFINETLLKQFIYLQFLETIKRNYNYKPRDYKLFFYCFRIHVFRMVLCFLKSCTETETTHYMLMSEHHQDKLTDSEADPFSTEFDTSVKIVSIIPSHHHTIMQLFVVHLYSCVSLPQKTTFILVMLQY